MRGSHLSLRSWISLPVAAFVGLALTGLLAMGSSCTTRDCSEERAGELRCVNNRLELCNDDGALSYDSCAANGLVCSEVHNACVTSDVAKQAGSGGSGSSTTSTGSTSSAGGVGQTSSQSTSSAGGSSAGGSSAGGDGMGGA